MTKEQLDQIGNRLLRTGGIYKYGAEKRDDPSDLTREHWVQVTPLYGDAYTFYLRNPETPEWAEASLYGDGEFIGNAQNDIGDLIDEVFRLRKIIRRLKRGGRKKPPVRCKECGRVLRQRDSVQSGLGPCCAAKIGRAVSRPVTAAAPGAQLARRTLVAVVEPAVPVGLPKPEPARNLPTQGTWPPDWLKGPCPAKPEPVLFEDCVTKWAWFREGSEPLTFRNGSEVGRRIRGYASLPDRLFEALSGGEKSGGCCLYLSSEAATAALDAARRTYQP